MWFLKQKQIPLTEFFPTGFVDIHSHMLPGIDDGAKDLEQTKKMLLAFQDMGVQKIITTPHIMGDLYPNTPPIIQNKLTLVRQLIEDNGIEIKLEAAAEYMLDDHFQEQRKTNETLIGLGNKTILIELSYFSPPLNLYEIIFDLKLNGYQLILAHPERYFSYHHNFNHYYKLKKSGCLFQLNLLALTPKYGIEVTKISQRLLKENLYDFVGTDAHSESDLKLLENIATKKNLKLLEGLMKRNVDRFR